MPPKKTVVHVVGTGTIGEPLIGLFSQFKQCWGIDEVTFSIDGATAESYVKYRQRGDFAKAIRNLTALCDEKRKNGVDVPFRSTL